MEFFRSFLRVIGLLEPTKVDVISELPSEVSQLILRKLDPESLLRAAQVSRKWMDVCRSDKFLRRSARRYIGGIERQRREEFLGEDSPKESRTTAPQGVREVSSVREVRRIRKPSVLSRNAPPVRFEAAVVFGRVQPPRNLQRAEYLSQMRDEFLGGGPSEEERIVIPRRPRDAPLAIIHAPVVFVEMKP